jgi:hypothetical protein
MRVRGLGALLIAEGELALAPVAILGPAIGRPASLDKPAAEPLAATAADPAARGHIELVFDALATYGGGIGEVPGVSLSIAFALGLLAIGALRRGGLPTWAAAFGLVAALSLGSLTLPEFGAPDLMPVAVAVSLLSLWMISVGARCVWGGPLK